MSALKLRSKVNFPATVTATGGIAVAKSNGIWRVEPDWSYLTLEVTVPNPSGRQLWTYDPNTGVYYRLSVQALIDNLPAGPPGSAATIAAGTTTTGKAGTNASVTNSGTSSAAVFDVTVPRGADAGIRYAFESSTSMSAPSSGGIRLNNAALASVTAIAVNATNADAVDVSDFVATWDDSTNTVKGYVELRKEGSGSVLGIYQITSVTDNTTWLQLALTYVSGSGSFTAADAVYLIPYRAGNSGTTFANPSASIGLTAVNGSASNAMRADGAPALSQSITPTWTSSHIFTGGIRIEASGAVLPIKHTTGGVDEKQWDLQSSNQRFSLRALNDAYAAASEAFGVTRSGYVLTGMQINTQTFAPLATITDGASLTWTVNANTGQKSKVTLGGSRTMLAVVGATEGATYFLWVIQDGTGSRTITWTTSGAGSFDFGTDGAPTLSTAANKADLLCFEAISIGGTLKLRYAGIKKGFA